MSTLLKDSLQKGISYQEYRQMVSDLFQDSKVTGPAQSEALLNYTKLNIQRMNRLDKTIHLSEQTISELSSLTKKTIWLVITEGWCGDAAQILPVLSKIEQASEAIEMQLVLRDENEELINAYLTNGGKSIPKVVILDAETKEEIANWGPRPAKAVALINEMKEQFGGMTDEVKQGLQKWYNDDKGQSIQEEFLAIIK